MFNIKSFCPLFPKFLFSSTKALGTLTVTSEKTKSDKFSFVLLNLWARAFKKLQQLLDFQLAMDQVLHDQVLTKLF
jgi:hypothetical protein